MNSQRKNARLFIAILMAMFTSVAWAQNDTLPKQEETQVWYEYDGIKGDSSALSLRSFSESTIEELRNNEDYNYDPPPAIESNSILDWIGEWLGDFLRRFFLDDESAEWLQTSIYLVAGVVLLHFLFKLFGVDMRGVFYRKSDSTNVRTDIQQEDIHERNFPLEIENAISNKKYREGIRLQYLYSLKLLSDREIIHWEIDKTNQEYSIEIRVAALKQSFKEITDIFEHIYYGDFPVTEGFYHKAASSFVEFQADTKKATVSSK